MIQEKNIQAKEKQIIRARFLSLLPLSGETALKAFLLISLNIHLLLTIKITQAGEPRRAVGLKLTRFIPSIRLSVSYAFYSGARS